MNLENIRTDNGTLFSWGRYLYWADLMCRNYDSFMDEEEDSVGEVLPDFCGLFSYWASSLYVVIEGWERAKFSDSIIDALLQVSDYKDALRRLRSVTFHFEPELLSQESKDFYVMPEVNLWVHTLHDEFCRWLRDFVEAVERSGRLSAEESQQWRQEFAKLVGWLPPKRGEQELAELRRKRDEIEKEIDATGDTSEAATELRKSLSLCDDAERKTVALVIEMRRERIAKLGLEPNNYVF